MELVHGKSFSGWLCDMDYHCLHFPDPNLVFTELILTGLSSEPRDPWTTLLCRECRRVHIVRASDREVEVLPWAFFVFLCGRWQQLLPSGLSASLKNSLLYACVYIPQKVFKCSEAVSFHGADGLQAWGEGLAASLVLFSGCFLCT